MRIACQGEVHFSTASGVTQSAPRPRESLYLRSHWFTQLFKSLQVVKDGDGDCCSAAGSEVR